MANTPGRTYIPSMVDRLPLFPLDVVLFPGTPLPLHIFEPRYRRLLADCLAGDARFGMVPTGPDHGPPGAGAVGCRGHVRATQALPDGRSHIVLVGESRFELQDYLPTDAPYLVGLVEPFDDIDPDHTPTPAQDRQLRTFYHDYAEALAVLHDTTTDPSQPPDSSAELVWQLAASLDLPLALQQELLATRSLRARIDQLLGRLPALVRQVRARAQAHTGAHTNGRSHAPDGEASA